MICGSFFGNSTFFVTTKSSVVKQKGKSQNGGCRKTKYIKFSEKLTHFLPPDTHVLEVFFGNMTPAQVFPCEFHKISKNRFFQRITPVAASGVEAKFFLRILTLDNIEIFEPFSYFKNRKMK